MIFTKTMQDDSIKMSKFVISYQPLYLYTEILSH